jgi:hypothetical protein
MMIKKVSGFLSGKNAERFDQACFLIIDCPARRLFGKLFDLRGSQELFRDFIQLERGFANASAVSLCMPG